MYKRSLGHIELSVHHLYSSCITSQMYSILQSINTSSCTSSMLTFLSPNKTFSFPFPLVHGPPVSLQCLGMLFFPPRSPNPNNNISIFIRISFVYQSDSIRISRLRLCSSTPEH